MRRSEKEIKDRKEIDEIINRATICRLGLSADNVPYIVPMSFGYDGKFLYFHGASEGRKIDMIKKNNHACFEIDVDTDLIKKEQGCGWSMKYRSVIGWGRISFVDDVEGKREALNKIMAHYSDKQFDFPEAAVKNTMVFILEVDEVTGKKSG